MDASSSANSEASEIEFKLEIEAAGAERLRAHFIPDDSAQSKQQVTIYYDTPDATLRDHGFTLRVRKVGDGFVQTIKPLTTVTGLISRAEYETDVSSLDPNLKALSGTPLGQLAKSGKLSGLQPTTQSDVRRTSWVIEAGGSRIQADLDEGKLRAGGRSQRFNELELELLSGDPACLLRATKDIAERVPVRLGVLTKAERGTLLAAGAFKKVAKAARVEVQPGMSIAEVFEIVVHACLRHYRLNETLAIASRKKEALHQARVALRRLRSAFTLFRPVTADVEYQYLRQELRWFTAQLGEARNLDVFLERELPDDERDVLTARREQAYDHVLAAMDSQRFRLLLIELVGWTALGPWRRGKRAARPIEHYASTRLDRLWSSIGHNGRHIAELDEETRHHLRIQVKKMRYALDFLRGLYPESISAKSFGVAVEDLQESLGKLNDLATARTLGAPPRAEQSWLIGSPDEKPLIREAERAFRDLDDVGPFWRHPHRADHVHA